MQILKETDKSDFLATLDALEHIIPVMDLDDRDFTATVLYRMAEIVRKHGPSHGVTIEPRARFIYSGGRSGGRMYEAALHAVLQEVEDRKKTVSGFKLDEGDIRKVIVNPPATVIYWKDGSKTVVKCSAEDIDAGRMTPEAGIVYAIAKKVLGNKGNYNDVLKRLVKRAKKN